MRRNLDKPYIDWGIRVPLEDFNIVVSSLPISRNWLGETGLRKFLELVEPNSSEPIRRWIHEQIADATRNGAPREPLHEFSISVPTALYVRFSKLFGEFGAATWFIRRYIHFLALDLSESGPTLEDRIEQIINRAMTPEVPVETSNEI